MLNETNESTTTNFNKKRNFVKSLMSLQGILKGVVTDKKLNEMELTFLSTWLRSHRAITSEGDALDLLDNIDDIVADGIVTAEELTDLQAQIEDVIDYGVIYPQCVEDLINELLGFVSGISADNVVTIDELNGLANWLNDNPDAVSCWPGNILHQKIIDVFSDDIVDDNELADLTQTCKMIAGQQFLETGVAEGMATEFCAQPLDFLPSNVETVSFTGKFLIGSRATLEQQAKALGIRPIKKDIPQYLNLLVIGSLANPDWRFSSHGRKIEKALMNQQKGFNTLIITEENWVTLVKTTSNPDQSKNIIVSKEIESSKHLRQQVCFTGFSSIKKKELEQYAKDNNFNVVTKVTQCLDFLIYGDNAGPKKMETAKKQNAKCLTETQFLSL